MLVFFQNCSRKPILCATNIKHWLVESFGTIGSQTFFLHFLQQIGTNFYTFSKVFQHPCWFFVLILSLYSIWSLECNLLKISLL